MRLLPANYGNLYRQSIANVPWPTLIFGQRRRHNLFLLTQFASGVSNIQRSLLQAITQTVRRITRRLHKG
jgi:hypothetical protein